MDICKSLDQLNVNQWTGGETIFWRKCSNFKSIYDARDEKNISLFGYDNDYKILLYCLHRLYSVAVSYPKKDWLGPSQPFFRYENDKDLKVCFLVMRIVYLLKSKILIARLWKIKSYTVMIIRSANKMSENVKKFWNTTSMHGVPWLINARSNKAKVFWGLVCVIGMFMFIYMLVSLVIKYFTFPVVIKVDQVRNLFSYLWFVPHVNFVKLETGHYLWPGGPQEKVGGLRKYFDV